MLGAVSHNPGRHKRIPGRENEMKIPAEILEAMQAYVKEVTTGPTLVERRWELRRCAAKTKRGERCRCYSLLDGQVCVTHNRAARINNLQLKSGAKLKL
jgi:hypothetical protein